MAGDDHWMDDRSKDSPFSRRKADLRMSRTNIPNIKPTDQRNSASYLPPRTFIGGKRPPGQSIGETSGKHDMLPENTPMYSSHQSNSGSGVSWPVAGQQPAPESAAAAGQTDSSLRNAQIPKPVALKLTEDEIDSLAMFDKQTGTFNFRYIANRFSYEFDRAMLFGRTVTVMIVAVDDLKNIGLEYGSGALDKVLETVATILRGSFRSIDLIGRFAEGRFIVVCPEIANDEITRAAQIIGQACAQIELKQQWHTYKFTVSIGIAHSSPDLQDPDSLLAFADLCADDATEAGGNSICFEQAAIVD